MNIPDEFPMNISHRELKALYAAIEQKSIEISTLRTENSALKNDKERLIIHLGNMLDDVIVTKRGEWSGDLYCVLCGCNITKNQPHSNGCKIGAANAEWDIAITNQQGKE